MTLRTEFIHEKPEMGVQLRGSAGDVDELERFLPKRGDDLCHGGLRHDFAAGWRAFQMAMPARQVAVPPQIDLETANIIAHQTL